MTVGSKNNLIVNGPLRYSAAIGLAVLSLCTGCESSMSQQTAIVDRQSPPEPEPTNAILARLQIQWSMAVSLTDDVKHNYAQKTFAAQSMTKSIRPIELYSVLTAFTDDKLSAEYNDFLPWMFDPLLEQLAKNNDVYGLTRLLAQRCPTSVQSDVPIELWLASDAMRLGCSYAFQAILDAYNLCLVPETKEDIVRVLRVVWESMGWQDGLTDEDVAGRFHAWYIANRMRYSPNDRYSVQSQSIPLWIRR